MTDNKNVWKATLYCEGVELGSVSDFQLPEKQVDKKEELFEKLYDLLEEIESYEEEKEEVTLDLVMAKLKELQKEIAELKQLVNSKVTWYPYTSPWSTDKITYGDGVTITSTWQPDSK